MPQPIFLPAPRHIRFLPGQLTLQDQLLIQVSAPRAHTLLFSAQRFQQKLKSQLGLAWAISASPTLPAEQTGLHLHLDPTSPIPTQGYTLTVTPQSISINASSEAGIFYAISTLLQLLQQRGPLLPCLQIEDWPDFPVRGVMLDISRDKVPTMETLYNLVDLLASWKINQFQLYTEHTFAYHNHPTVWAKASPITSEEILALDLYCRQRCIELVPNQNSFGHLRRWLIHPEYAPLAEIHGPFQTPWGSEHGPYSLAPVDPGSLKLVSSLYDELLPHFSSRMVNVGCDETFDLGAGRSRELVEKYGQGQVYLDYLLEIYANLKARGHTMQFWGDIILAHPELIPSLPKDVIALLWGYEADHPYEQQCRAFQEAGIPFYVCPGTSSWNSLAGRSDNALRNLMQAAENGLKFGATGYLITDWGDNGHFQQLPVSYLGFAAGAAYSWALQPNLALDLTSAVSAFAFQDAANLLGCVAYQLGNVYRAAGYEPINTSVVFSLIQYGMLFLSSHPLIQQIDFDAILARIDLAMQPFASAQPQGPDADLLRCEFLFTAALLRHACHRGKLAALHAGGASASEAVRKLNLLLSQEIQALLPEYETRWLARNRPGGLEDSIARLARTRLDYIISESAA